MKCECDDDDTVRCTRGRGRDAIHPSRSWLARFSHSRGPWHSVLHPTPTNGSKRGMTSALSAASEDVRDVVRGRWRQLPLSEIVLDF